MLSKDGKWFFVPWNGVHLHNGSVNAYGAAYPVPIETAEKYGLLKKETKIPTPPDLRGTVDERGLAELIKTPGLTDNQLARLVGCTEKTIQDSKKCPRIAMQRAILRDSSSRYRSGDRWVEPQDREDD